MTTPRAAEQLVEVYLDRLDWAAAGLPPDRRDDLLDGIREHIAAARAADGVADEAAVRTLLDRLGTPEEIVAAAHDDDSPPRGAAPRDPVPPEVAPFPAPPGPGPSGPPGAAATLPGGWGPVPTASPWGPLEVAAVVLLGLGGCVLPVVGTLVGLPLAFLSSRWSRRDKGVAAVLALGPAVVAVLFVLLAGMVA